MPFLSKVWPKPSRNKNWLGSQAAREDMFFKCGELDCFGVAPQNLLAAKICVWNCPTRVRKRLNRAAHLLRYGSTRSLTSVQGP
jgi:hypothetical protein